MLDQTDKIAQFLERVLPWDGQHVVSIHQKRTYASGATGIPGQPFKTLNQALDHIAYKRRTKNLADIYLPLSSQLKVEERTTDGRKWLSAIRKIENMHLLKCFYIDLDVKAEGGYPDTLSAIKALNAVPLPEPNVIVKSGTGGLHCYWTFDLTFTFETWKPRAEGLVALCLDHGLKFDTGCTTDPVRLLRVPETFNAKTNPPSPVTMTRCREDQSLEDFDKAIADYIGKTVEPVLTPGSNAEPPSELGAGIEPTKAALRDIAALEKECPWITHNRTTGGVDADNWQRRLLFQISVACDDARNVAWSMMHNRRAPFGPDEFIKEFDRAEQERADGNAKWPSCKTIESKGSKQCAGCKHRGGTKGPLQVGYQTQAQQPPPPQQPTPGAAQPTSNDMPSPYKRGANTGWILKEVGPGIPDEVILPYAIKDAWVSPSPWEAHFTTEKAGRVIPVTITWEDAATEQALAKSLQKQGVAVHNPSKVKQFMTSFLQQLQNATDRVASSQPFGWLMDDTGKEDGFVYAGKRFTPQGIKIAAPPKSPDFREAYTPKGDIKTWRELVGIINGQKRPALDVLIATAFAAPLVKFSGDDGYAIGGWDMVGGAGKSTALKIAAAVWGEPQRAKGGMLDTRNQVTARMSMLKHLPVYWDEVREMEDQKALARLVSVVTEGKGRNRLNRNADFGKMETWLTNLTYTTNVSIRALINEIHKATPAASMRTFEFIVPKVEISRKIRHRIKYLMSHLPTNYGHAGLIYAEFIGTHQVEAHQTVLRVSELLAEQFQFTDEERFWQAAIATILVGAHYANKLGLADFDLPLLRKFLIEELKKMRISRASSESDLSRGENLADILGGYLREKRPRNTIYTNKIWLAGKPRRGDVEVLYAEGAVTRDTLQVQIAQDNHMFRMTEKDFRQWLKERDINAQTVLSGLATKFGMQRINGGFIGSGTEYVSAAKEILLQFSTTGTELEQYIEWEQV